jgi:hypothetical protein
MRIQTFTITGNDLRKIILAFFDRFHGEGHISRYKNGMIVYTEHHSFMTNSNLLTAVRYDFEQADAGMVTIECIAGGGKEGWLSMSWGSEGRRIDKYREELAAHCGDNKLHMKVHEESTA